MTTKESYALLLTIFQLGVLRAVSGQDFAFVEPDFSWTVPVIEGKDASFKDSTSSDETPPKYQNWLFHVQGTEIAQGQLGFHSPYAGTNSLRSDDNFKQALSRSTQEHWSANLFKTGAGRNRARVKLRLNPKAKRKIQCKN